MLYIVYIAIHSCLVLLFCDRLKFVHENSQRHAYNKYYKTKTLNENKEKSIICTQIMQIIFSNAKFSWAKWQTNQIKAAENVHNWKLITKYFQPIIYSSPYEIWIRYENRSTKPMVFRIFRIYIFNKNSKQNNENTYIKM